MDTNAKVVETAEGLAHYHRKPSPSYKGGNRQAIQYFVGECSCYRDIEGWHPLLNVTMADGTDIESSLTPESARKLARILTKMADHCDSKADEPYFQL